MPESPPPQDALALLHALECEPLDVHQLAARLAIPPFAVREQLAVLSAAEQVDSTVTDNGREIWALSDRGRSGLR